MSHFSGLTIYQKTYEYVEPILRSKNLNSTLINNICEYSSSILLTELLPYDSCSRKKAKIKVESFNEYALLLRIVKSAINALKMQNFLMFDPLVGDNACQIRAFKIALIFLECLAGIHKLETEIDMALKRIFKILKDPNKLSALCKNDDSFDSLLKKFDLDIELSPDEFFLIQSYVLTTVMVVLPFKVTKAEKTDPRKIQKLKLGEVSFNFVNNFVNLSRHQMAQESVSIVRAVAWDLFEKDLSNANAQLVEMTSRKFTIYHRDLPCLSIFWSTLTLMQQALKKQIPIIVWAEQVANDNDDYKVVHETFIFFESNGLKYQEKLPSSEDFGKIAIMIQGSACEKRKNLPDPTKWRKKMAAIGPIDLFLAYAAPHRQYPDSSRDYLITDLKNPLLNSYVEKSKEWGCNLEDPSFFFTTHVSFYKT